MNFVSLMDLAAAAASLTALLFILFAARRTPWKPEVTLFTFVIILAVSHDVGNFLEWAGYTNWFDPVEDFLEVLTAALWAFFFYTFFQELTERKLRQIQDLDEKILDGSPVAFVLRSSDLRVLKVSKAFKKVTGYDPAAVMGKSIEEFMPDMPGRQELEARHRKVLESGGQVGPTEMQVPSPVPRFIRETIFPVRGLEEGNVTNTLSVLEDITAQVEAERKLREVQELDEKILDGSPVAFVLHDLDMRIIRVSSAYEKVTGFKTEDVQDRTLKEFMPDGSQKDDIIQRIEYVQEQMLQVGPKDIESPVPGHYLRETILPIFSPEGRLVNTLSVLEDITEQKHARDALEESESRYKMLFDSIHDGVVVHEIEKGGRPGRFLEVNRTFCQMTGYSRKELLEITPLDLSESSRYAVASVRKTLLGGGSTSFERVLISKTGEELPCEMKAHSFKLGDKQVILSVVRDITERKKAHDRISSSLAEKETLLREIHHRVKNNLQVISGLLNLQAHYIDDERVRTIYKESQNRIKTMALIHEELYQREDLARINLAEYISGLAGNLMASYSMEIGRVSLDLDLEDAEITIDTAIPCGLIVNEIVSNSLAHAFPDNGKGKIRIKLRLLDGEKFELKVSDDGIGLPADLKISKTKTLGLRLVSILAEQLGADLQVEKDQGTAFCLTFKEYLEAGAEMY
ncbi:MAG: PAS domain S-box protein [bacterium]|nr:PAS domain S-box protein [bacterium]